MSYVDGYIVPVPKANKENYRRMAEAAAAIFAEHGAIGLMEAWADDVPHGQWTDFYRAVQCTDEETVVFSWIIWPDKAARDAGSAAVMADPRMSREVFESQFGEVFDGKRMVYGGFMPLVTR
jgi:uncharacterized protein YbaA (DUF1428 family)